MLGEMQAIEAGCVGGLDEAKPLIEQGCHRTLAEFDVIEQSDFHDFSANVSLLPRLT
jgi:hypothetical protein